MKDKINNLLKDRLTVGLIIVVIVLVIGGIFGYSKFLASKTVVSGQEIDLSFDPEGPYALLQPRRDGNALILDLKRTASYDSISYELAYTSLNDETTVTATKSADEEGAGGGTIDRGVVGDINTKDKKGEYTQEILFGTCSKNVCKYDKGVENGTLTLHIKKGNEAYRMVTEWHFQHPDIALGQLSSGDNHFKYNITASQTDLSFLGYSITNELTGVPKLPDGKEVSGKVYALNLPETKQLMPGQVSIELADNPPSSAKIYWYTDQKGWQALDTKISGSTLQANGTSNGIFTVLVDKK